MAAQKMPVHKKSGVAATGKSKVISTSTPKWVHPGGRSVTGGNTSVKPAKAR